MEAVFSHTQREEKPAFVNQPSLLSRRYVVPLLLACAILFCSTATGINTIIGYNTDILPQSGLSDVKAHWGYVIFTLLNFLMTVAAMTLVDRKGRRFLMVVGTTGMMLSLAMTGCMFRSAEQRGVDVTAQLRDRVGPEQELSICVNSENVQHWAPGMKRSALTLVVLYAYGDFTSTTPTIRLEGAACSPIRITREASVPDGKVEAFIRNPLPILQKY